jgi:hypothetical protein
MSSPRKRSQERIEQIEKFLVNIFPNVISKKIIESTHTETIVESSRIKRPDGFYIFTIRKGNDSHGILVYKETHATQGAKYYLYEPNGRRHINEGYTFNVRISSDSSFVELDTRMVPERSINDHVGHCALWCIIVIILWNSFEGNDRWVALDIFNTQMMSDFKVRKDFIENVQKLVLNRGKSYTDERQVIDFIEQVRALIFAIPIVIP